MTFLQAAEAVLRSAKRPLSVAEITERAISQGLVRATGKTPVATMSAALYRAHSDAHVRREFQAGPSRAVRGSVRWVYGSKER